MNSEITVYDVKLEINDKIEERIKQLYKNIYEFDELIDIDNLNDWCNNMEYDIKIIKNLKLLEDRINSKDFFTDDDIDYYHILACKPERINIRKKKIKNWDPIIEKLISKNVEYVE